MTETELPDLHCRFCRKTQHEVATLIAGPDDLNICDECVTLLCDIIAGQNDPWRKRLIERLAQRDPAS